MYWTVLIACICPIIIPATADKDAIVDNRRRKADEAFQRIHGCARTPGLAYLFIETPATFKRVPEYLNLRFRQLR